MRTIFVHAVPFFHGICMALTVLFGISCQLRVSYVFMRKQATFVVNQPTCQCQPIVLTNEHVLNANIFFSSKVLVRKGLWRNRKRVPRLKSKGTTNRDSQAPITVTCFK